MEKKQTAIEWLMDKLPLSIESWYSKQIEQAKAMEKEQIMDAFDIRKIDISFDKKTTAEQYYNETYSSKVNDECYFEPTNNTSSATICKHCGKEKSLHTIT